MPSASAFASACGLASPPSTTDTSLCDSEATKTCSTCYDTLPLEEFRYRNKAAGTRMHECNGCHAKRERERARQKRRRRMSKFTGVVGREQDGKRVAALVRRMVESLGGVDAMCAQWSEHLKYAMRERPGDPVVLRSFGALMRMLQFVEERREPEGDFWGELSDEELEAIAGMRIGEVAGGEGLLPEDLAAMSDAELEELAGVKLGAWGEWPRRS